MKRLGRGRSILVPLVLAWLAVAQARPAAAQEGLYLSGGFSLPVGQHGDTNFANPDAGFSLAGISLTAHYDHQLSFFSGLRWTSSVGVSAQLVDDKHADRLVAHEDVSIRPYWIAPVLTGVRYQSEGSSPLSPWVGVSAGLFLVKGPDIEAQGLTADYKIEPIPGFGVSGGVSFTTRLGVGARYLSTGQTELEMTLGTDNPDEFFVTHTISYWDLYLTYDI